MIFKVMKNMQISASISEQLPPSTPQFIAKLYSMIKLHSTIISFSQDGLEVHILDYNKFVDQMLQKYFRHGKWKSFIRQMNMYSFKKINRGMKSYIFVNTIFRRGNENNYWKIKRKINSKQDQIEAQNNLEVEVQKLLTQQSKDAGILNNLNITIQNSTQQRPNSLNTLPSLTGPFFLPSSNLVNQTSETYTNSLLFFVQSMLSFRKRTESLCSEIKQNMEYITKQRKTTESKNLMSTVKDSIQMIDQMSNKVKERMQIYVDQMSKDAMQDRDLTKYKTQVIQQPDYNVIQTKKNIESNNRKIPINMSKQNNTPQLISNSSSTSTLNPPLIIPQPILTKLQQNPYEQLSKKNNKIILQSSIRNYKPNSPSISQNLNQTPIFNNLTTNIPRNNNNANNNTLNVSSYCSFNSVSQLLN